MSELDLEFVRAQFPAFAEPSLAKWAFFENAGGSYASRFVIDRLHRFYQSRKMQPYGPGAPTKAAGEEMDEARDRLSALLNVQNDELSFGPSTTQNTYVLSQAFREFLSPGDVVIVTQQDHEANSGPWRRLADAGLIIREWAIDPDTGALDIAELENLLDDKVKLVAFPHCSNIVGQVNPVAEICALVHQAGAIACVDGVSYAPHGLPDVKALGADIYLFSAYKTFGPHLGLMYIRRELAQALPNQAHYFNAGSLSKKFTPAGPDHAQIAAAAGMADYVDHVYSHHFDAPAEPIRRAEAVRQLQSDNEAAVLAPLIAFLNARNDVRLIGQSLRDKVPTIAFSHKRSGEDLAVALAAKNVIAGGGDFYANRCLEALGIDPAHGVLRVSFVHYTTPGEVETLIKALDAVL